MTIRKALVLAAAALIAGALDAAERIPVCDSSESAYLLLRGVPDKAIVVINSDTIIHFLTRPIKLPAGVSDVLVSVAGEEHYSQSLSFKPDERKIIDIRNNPDRAGADIISEPLDAEVFINGKKAGVTPFLDSLVKPGLYKLEIKKPGYDPFMEMVLLAPREELELSPELKHSQQWIDSVAHENFLRRQKKRFIARVACGALGLALSGASIYFDRAACRNLQNADASAGEYDAAAKEFQPHKDKYYQNRDLAKQDIGKRNILAVLSAGAGIGFVFSFVF